MSQNPKKPKNYLPAKVDSFHENLLSCLFDMHADVYNILFFEGHKVIFEESKRDQIIDYALNLGYLAQQHNFKTRLGKLTGGGLQRIFNPEVFLSPYNIGSVGEFVDDTEEDLAKSAFLFSQHYDETEEFGYVGPRSILDMAVGYNQLLGSIDENHVQIPVQEKMNSALEIWAAQTLKNPAEYGFENVEEFYVKSEVGDLYGAGIFMAGAKRILSQDVAQRGIRALVNMVEYQRQIVEGHSPSDFSGYSDRFKGY